MSQPQASPGVPRQPGWRLGLLAPAVALVGQLVPPLLLFLPVPLAVLTDLRGWRAGVAWSLAAAGAVAVLHGWMGLEAGTRETLPLLLSGALLVLLVAGMGLVGGHAYRRDWHPALCHLAPAVFALGVLAIVWVAAWVAWGVDVVRLAVESWRSVMEESFLRSLEAGGASASQLEAWRANLEQMAQGVFLLFPAGLAVTTGFWSVVAQWLAGRWLLGLGRPLRPVKPFGRWRFPWMLAWGYIAGQLLLVAVRAQRLTGSEATLLALGLNLVFFFTHLFFVEGLAVVWFYLEKWGVGKGGRWLVSILLLTPFLPLVEPVAWLGMLDAWLDFRKLQREGGP
ncbi:DUF2232 domain-containing protein [Limnochorda pilosa]|uniref:DUF2232 domain-containing protein n=1 Tax=Limnochorda pilosa TaxID=1555112 RepID=A0A0K2SQM3_LIMPI|nr:DUF2232 domain-containing protein [Limnochorda pilosa]BAS29433.1 hypothetical protein LIP_3625 [Limnochorda pilosa]